MVAAAATANCSQREVVMEVVRRDRLTRHGMVARQAVVGRGRHEVPRPADAAVSRQQRLPLLLVRGGRRRQQLACTKATLRFLQLL